MARNGTLLLLIPLWLAGCSITRPLSDDPYTAPSSVSFFELPSEPSLDVLVFGDWGTGGPGQRQMARAMEDTYRYDPPDLVLTVGDNFYDDGVDSTEDPIWNRVFEKVYSGPFWDSLTFYPSLGNHDWYGNRIAQVRYSNRNPRWKMPAVHYAFRKAIPGGDSVLFLALDTTPLQGEWNGSVEQLAWMDSVLVASDDRWIVTYGHHPLASNGFHRQDDYFRERVIPLLSGRSRLYLAGHNHSMEILPVSPDLLQGVCGGGAGRDNPYPVRKTDQTVAAFTNGGWCYLRIFPEVLAVELYNRDGEVEFRYLIPGTPR